MYFVYINNKTKEEYIVVGICINTTNSVDGQMMIMYKRYDPQNSPYYVRECNEFYEKFTKVEES